MLFRIVYPVSSAAMKRGTVNVVLGLADSKPIRVQRVKAVDRMNRGSVVRRRFARQDQRVAKTERIEIPVCSAAQPVAPNGRTSVVMWHCRKSVSKLMASRVVIDPFVTQAIGAVSTSTPSACAMGLETAGTPSKVATEKLDKCVLAGAAFGSVNWRLETRLTWAASSSQPSWAI